MADNTYMKLRMEAKIAIKKTFESPSKKHFNGAVLKTVNEGLYKDEVEGVIELMQ